jgi:hypothetical protein
MKIETLRKIAREYRLVADRKLDDKELCKGFSDLCREEGIAWTQLRALVDAEAADARDGGHRVGKIVEKADFASSYAEILACHKDEPKRQIRSSSVSIAAGTPAPAQRPVQQEPAVQVVETSKPSNTAIALQASVALQRSGGDPFDSPYPDMPAFLDRRPS